MAAMKIMLTSSRVYLPLALAGLLAAGCNSKPANTDQTAAPAPAPAAGTMSAAPPAGSQMSAAPAPVAPAPAAPMAAAPMAPAPARVAPPAPVVYTIPADTRISVSLGETIDSKTATEGQAFSATVSSPVVVGGRTIIRSGSRASGTVVATKNRGRFKGEGFLELQLDSVTAEGRNYPVQTATVERVSKGKGKRTAVLAGGGAGLGALIGGLAGGGKGALIGGLAGGGAGTAGTAFTDNKPIVIPAETVLTFRLSHSVTVR